MNAKRNSLVIIYQIPNIVFGAPQVMPSVMPNVAPSMTPSVAPVMSPRMVINAVPMPTVAPTGVPTVAPKPVANTITSGLGRTWGVVNIIDGQVILPTSTFDDPIYTYEGDLLLDYSYYVNENNILKPIRSANMVEPVDVAAFRLAYDAANCILNVDGKRELTSTTMRMPSVLAVVYMLSQRGYIDISYSKCVDNYCKVFNLCLSCGASLQSPLSTGTSIIDTDRKAFYNIDPTKWDITSVKDVVIPYIPKEFYIINSQAGVHRVLPIDKFGVKWCTIETTWGERYEVLWEALVIYVEKLFTHL